MIFLWLQHEVFTKTSPLWLSQISTFSQALWLCKSLSNFQHTRNCSLIGLLEYFLAYMWLNTELMSDGEFPCRSLGFLLFDSLISGTLTMPSPKPSHFSVPKLSSWFHLPTKLLFFEKHQRKGGNHLTGVPLLKVCSTVLIFVQFLMVNYNDKYFIQFYGWL